MPKQEAEHQRAKAERQAELAVAAELARASADDEAQRLRSKFARSDKGTALLKAARLKMELEACREKLALAEASAKEQVSISICLCHAAHGMKLDLRL